MLYKQIPDCHGLRIDWQEIIIAELQFMFKITTFSFKLYFETSAETCLRQITIVQRQKFYVVQFDKYKNTKIPLFLLLLLLL